MDGETLFAKSHTHTYEIGLLDLSLSIEKNDPYFLWALANEGRRLGSIMPAMSVIGEKPVKVEKYVQVLIEIWDGSFADDAMRAARINEFWQFVKAKNLVWVRGAYSRADRFVTGIVPDFHLVEFLREIANFSSRFEIGHSIGEPELLRTDVTAPASQTSERAYTDQPPPELLTGNVMVIIDYGCPFAHTAFRDATLSTKSRIHYVWFQDANAVGREAHLPRVLGLGGRSLFHYGRELTGAAIDAVLAANLNAAGQVDETACYDSLGYDLMRQSVTHGGHVMDVACGRPNPLAASDVEDWLTGSRTGAASRATAFDKAGEASIIFVELPRSAVGDSSGAGMNVYLVDALQYAMKRTAPSANVVINCSFGTHAGPHDGSSMLERAVSCIVQSRDSFNVSFVLPAGNAFNSGGHATGITSKVSPLEFTFDVAADKATDTFVEVWYSGEAPLSVRVAPPQAPYLASVGCNALATWAQPWCPSVPMCTVVHTANATSTSHLMLIVIAPTRPRDAVLPEAAFGHWRLEIASSSDVNTRVDAWIERDDPIFEPPGDRQTRFVTEIQPEDQDEYTSATVTKFGTLNSYATAASVYSVGAAVIPTQRFSEFSAGGAEPQMSRYSSAGSDARSASLSAPYFVAYADDSDVLLGRNAAGSRSRAVVRLSGTSVASPQVARDMLNVGGPFGTSIPFRPSSVGALGDGLSVGGDCLQMSRAGLGLLVP